MKKYYMQIGNRKYYFSSLENAVKAANEIAARTNTIMGIESV